MCAQITPIELNNYMQKERASIKPTTDFTLLVPMFWDNLNNDLKNLDFNSIIASSTPLNVQLFLSLHIVHIKQRGIAFHTSFIFSYSF
jgi:hypothetical protein